jgi:hypothetical protein
MDLKQLKSEISELKEIINEIANLSTEAIIKLGGHPTLTPNQTTFNAKLKEYETVGNFVRHYSVTRSAVLTFLVGLTFGITGFILTKWDILEPTVLTIGFSVSFFILIIACFFNYFLSKYLKDVWDIGGELEDEINSILKQLQDDNLKIQFYRDNRLKGIKIPIINKNIDGPTICLWFVTIIYFLAVLIGIPLLDP